VLLDLVCGTAACADAGKSSSHLPADVAVRAPLFVVSDIYRRRSATWRRSDPCRALGVLDIVDDLPAFLQGLRGY